MADDLEHKFNRLLADGFIPLDSEWEVIEITQRLRKNLFPMEKVEINLRCHNIFIKK